MCGRCLVHRVRLFGVGNMGTTFDGWKLVIVPFAVSRSPRDFYELLSTERVTVLNQTPSAFSC